MLDDFEVGGETFLPYPTFLTDETDKELTVRDFSNVITQWSHGCT